MIIKSPRNTYDIVIVGGGMVGGTFAVTLSETLKDKGLEELVVFGGGIIPDEDISGLKKIGV